MHSCTRQIDYEEQAIFTKRLLNIWIRFLATGLIGTRFFALLFLVAGPTSNSFGADVEFVRDIWPIFQRSCVECHGAAKQEGQLRLDRADAVENGAIVRNDAAASELVRRIALPKGSDEVMPSRGDTLAKHEIQLMRKWIDSGAQWPADTPLAKHWSYVAPVKPLPPAMPAEVSTPIAPIDAFVFKRLRLEGIQNFAPEAPRETLIRRLSLDLIGLPPSPNEVKAFVEDANERAYEKVVDRLLDSDQFGVRWARPWLDYARYADSHGFQRDDFRDLWPYRDWVVDALNADMPFTQFTIEQIAGDLLPDATLAQRIATGFNRSSPTNVEAGSDPEETRVNQIHDRINTLGMIWLGATLECAQCHDHKYDPISQRDYYGLFAFFNNTSLEADRTNPSVPGSIQFSGPIMELADPETADQRQSLQTQLEEIKASILAKEQASTSDRSNWESQLLAALDQTSQEELLEITAFQSSGGSTHEVLPDGSILISGEPAPEKDTYTIVAHTKLQNITRIKLEALTHDSLPGKGPGRGDESRPNFVLNNIEVQRFVDGSDLQPVAIVDAEASFSQANFPVKNLIARDNSSRSGWAINPRFHQSHWAVLVTDQPMNGAPEIKLQFRLEQNFGGGRTIGRLRLTAMTGQASVKTIPAPVRAALQVAPDKRNAKQTKLIVEHYLSGQPDYMKLVKQRDDVEAKLKSVKPPTTLVMREDTPRMSAIFARGDFRKSTDPVQPHTPAALHPMQASSTLPNRLDLARWLVSRDNPLVARVVVNRWWSELFGRGLVSTPEDFGIKGELPSHPELLDWLASGFMDNGWSMKSLLKTIVMSQTYRQNSRVTSEMIQRDDRNQLLARGPRYRMEAEMIRDNALAIAGLLSDKQGGPPIRPFQPDGVWIKVGGQKYDYETSPGQEKYRRGLYVVWKRGAPYPSFVNFDANSRLSCRVQRPRSNTPLQALTLLNDPVYVEAAKAFARRVIVECEQASDSQRLVYAFQLATCRQPKQDELSVLERLLARQREAKGEAGSEDGSNKSGPKKDGPKKDGPRKDEASDDFPLPDNVSADEFSAWYAVAATLLNLDETISKN